MAARDTAGIMRSLYLSLFVKWKFFWRLCDVYTAIRSARKPQVGVGGRRRRLSLRLER
jgi:hypothetical protein